MSFLNNTGLATQINIIKAYVQSQINAATSVLNTSIAAMTPVAVGTVQAFAGSIMPEGWLLCDGSAISRTTYAALFNTIGDTYGGGDGETTFNLPDLIDKFIEGSTAVGTEKAAGLPDIVGKIRAYSEYNLNNSDFWANHGGVDGAFHWDATLESSEAYGTSTNMASGTNDAIRNVRFNASASNAIYGNSTTVQPPAVTMKYIIKY